MASAARGRISDASEESLDLYSFNHLEYLLNRSRKDLRAIASSAARYYSPYEKTKPPRPFANNPIPAKPRTIDNPQEPLKTVQHDLLDQLLRPLILPSHLLGGTPGKTVRDNALLHLGAKRLIVIDIKQFFPSITPIHVYGVWRRLLNCSPRIAKLLTKLTTYRHHLPQGAPTSTILANLVLASIDTNIRNACAAAGVRYSSWVDDLAFSGDRPEFLMEFVIATLHNAGFSVAHRKIAIMGPGSRKVLNSIVLSKIPRVEKEYLSRLRSAIHNLKVGRVGRVVRERYIRSLRGKISYVRLFDARKAAKFDNALESVLAIVA